ncbi:MAG: major capsid protein [Xanthomonadales bacterium]|nr:hypothetical protein [Anaerolineae bacterium]MCC6593002.1 major capsid protein [Xanthomonadales bacterium]MCE7932785.1 hypothetical protein [Xanthomonadales bacterium PRO6]
MTQMTPAAARVIDPVLTEIARGYKNNQMVASALFPVVPVGQRGGKVISFGRESFKLYNTGRAPGGNVARITSAHSADSYALEEHAIAEQVPIELMEDAAAVPGIDLGRNAVARGQDVIALRLEKQAADLATTAATYDSANKATLAGATQWSHASSNPITAIEAAKEVIRGKIGRRPNTLVVGGAVFAALKTNPAVIARMVYTSREIATAEILAQLFGLDRVVVGDAVYDDGTSLVDVWGKFAILAYTETAGLADAGRPSYGYTYQLRNYPVVEQPYYDPNTRSWVYPIADSVKPVIAGADAGFLWTDAAA